MLRTATEEYDVLEVISVEDGRERDLHRFGFMGARHMGMVKWQGKMDVNGAAAAWEELLCKNPNRPHLAEVEQLIAARKTARQPQAGTKNR